MVSNKELITLKLVQTHGYSKNFNIKQLAGDKSSLGRGNMKIRGTDYTSRKWN
jgi:hypothetical protein